MTLMSLIAKTDRQNTEIKELRDEIKNLSATVQQMIFERQRDRDDAEYVRELAKKDHELLISRLETRLLRHERSLQPTSDANEDDTP